MSALFDQHSRTDQSKLDAAFFRNALDIQRSPKVEPCPLTDRPRNPFCRTARLARRYYVRVYIEVSDDDFEARANSDGRLWN